MKGLSRTSPSAFSAIWLASLPVMATQTRGKRRGKRRGGNEGAAFIKIRRREPNKALQMNGELLQGLNYLCNRGLTIHLKNFAVRGFYPGVRNTLVTLTHPYPVVTFRLSLSFLAFD